MNKLKALISISNRISSRNLRTLIYEIIGDYTEILTGQQTTLKTKTLDSYIKWFSNMIESNIHFIHTLQAPKSTKNSITINNDSASKVIKITIICCNDNLKQILDNYIRTENIYSGHIMYYSDFRMNNSVRINTLKKYRSICENLKMIARTTYPYDQIIDIKQFSGNFISSGNIIFGACYLMWFGKDFFKFIPQEKLQGFTDCYKNETLENGTVRIQLYEDINDFRSEETDRRQWAFRKYADIDNVAEAWEKKYQALTRLDHSCANMEIEDGKFELGGVKRVKTYLDANGKNTIKKLAVKVHITEYDSSGKKIFSETVKVVENENIKS